MKQKTKKIVATILTIFMLLGIYSFAYATDNTETNASQQQNSAEYLLQMQINEGDKFVTGNNVTVDELIDGNVFVFANEVTLKREIAGDVFIFANKVNIETDLIYKNVYICGNNVTVNGGISGDLYVCANTFVLGSEGFVYRDLNAFTQSTQILGTVRRNVYLSTANLSFSNNNAHGAIYGNLTYTANKQVQIPEDTVLGNVSFEQAKTITASIVPSLISALVFVLIIWALTLLVAPKFTKASGILVSQKFLPTIGVGLLTCIGIPALCLLFLMIPYLQGISLTILTVFILAICLSFAITCIAFANYIASKFKTLTWYKTLLMVAVLVVVLVLLKQIPFFGIFIEFACVVIGLGTMVMNLFYGRGKQKEKVSKEENVAPKKVIKEKEKEEDKKTAEAKKIEAPKKEPKEESRKTTTKKTDTKKTTNTTSSKKAASKGTQKTDDKKSTTKKEDKK